MAAEDNHILILSLELKSISQMLLFFILLMSQGNKKYFCIVVSSAYLYQDQDNSTLRSIFPMDIRIDL